jgi:hypothetical protein
MNQPLYPGRNPDDSIGLLLDGVHVGSSMYKFPTNLHFFMYTA